MGYENLSLSLSNTYTGLQNPVSPAQRPPFSQIVSGVSLSLPSPQTGVSSRTVSRGNVCPPRALLADTDSKSGATVGPVKTKSPIVVIDNYDSFIYNLCQYMGELGCDFAVYRNDELTVKELKEKNPRGVLISPGPGAPKDSFISLQTVLEIGPIVPLFGVCMGLQCIGEAFGGRIVRAPHGVMHGKSLLFATMKKEKRASSQGCQILSLLVDTIAL
uniref:anthranilate synthase n=1 Tax=Kalanchoe fedtschenkoi TaxID=63787 RepID=A0A7N0ZTX1_KALFE